MNPIEYISQLAKKYFYLERMDNTPKYDKNKEYLNTEGFIPYGDKAQRRMAYSGKAGIRKFFRKGKDSFPFSFKGGGEWGERE